jgi:chromate reductase
MLLQTARECAPAGMDIEVFGSPESIPLFNEDIEAAEMHGPEPVRHLRRLVEAADGLIIATPEYNQSMPGVLKNNIDWLSRPGPGEVLAGKPVAVMGATSGAWGTRLAQHALRQTLTAIGARAMPEPALYVRDASRLFDASGVLVDSDTRAQLSRLLAAFDGWVDLLQQGTATSSGAGLQCA